MHDATYDSGTASTGCFDGTRIAVLDELSAWIKADHGDSVFWLSGMSGTGKSAVARTLCERSGATGLYVVSFFVSRDFSARRTPVRILQTIAYLLARYLRPFRRQLIADLRELPRAGKTRPLGEQVDIFLRAPLARCAVVTPRPIILVIDALDECSQRGGDDGASILGGLLSVIRNSPLPIRLVFTSRNQPSIAAALSNDAGTRTLCLDDIAAATVQQDIRAYLGHHLAVLQPAEIEALSVKANCLFLYAATVVRFVHAFIHNDVLHAVAEITAPISEPVTEHTLLDNLYSRIILNSTARCENPSNVFVHSVIRALGLLREPVSAMTLARLIGSPEEHVDAVVQSLSAVLAVDSAGVIRFFNTSFSDFLLDPARSSLIPFGADSNEVNSHLLLGCLRLMNAELRSDVCGIGAPCRTNAEVMDLEGRVGRHVSPGLAYASKYWASHMESSTVLSPVQSYICSELDVFCRQNLLYWIEVLSLMGCPDQAYSVLVQAESWCSNAPASDADRELAGAAASLARARSLAATISNALLAVGDNILQQSTAGILYIDSSPDDQTSVHAQTFVLRIPRQPALRFPFVSRPAIATERIAETPVSNYRWTRNVATSTDGGLVAGVAGHAIQVFDGSSRTILASLPIPVDWSSHVEVHFSSDGRSIVAGGVVSAAAGGGESLALAMWKRTQIPDEWQSLGVFAVRDMHSEHFALSADGTFVAFSFWRGVRVCRVHALETPTAEYAWPAEPGHASLAFSPDGTLLAAIAENGWIYVWDLRSSPHGFVMPASANYHSSRVHWPPIRHWLEFSENGKRLHCRDNHGGEGAFDIAISGPNIEIAQNFDLEKKTITAIWSIFISGDTL